MATKRIKLSPSEIAKEVKKLNDIKTDIQRVGDKKTEDVLEQAVVMCKRLTPFGVGDGDHLLFHTFWEKTGRGYRLVQRGKNVAYVEFGTGVVGAKHAHPKAGLFGWAYNIGPTIFTTKEGRTGWFFPTGEQYTSSRTGRTSEVHKFTQGQKASMQMFYTGEWLKRKLGVEIRYVLIKKVNEWFQ